MLSLTTFQGIYEVFTQNERDRWYGLVGAIPNVGLVLALIIPRFLLAPYLLLVVALYALASLLYTPTASALVADLGPTALRGRYLAPYEFSWGVADALTSVLFTALYIVTPALPWMVLAVIIATSGMITLWLERRFSAQAARTRRRPKNSS